MGLEAFLVNRLQAQEHVLQPQAAPVGEDLFVAHQHVGAGFQVVLLLDLALFQLVADRKAVLGMNERHVVNDEDVGLPDRSHVLGCGFGGGFAVAAAVKGPGAAKRTIPWTAAGELD